MKKIIALLLAGLLSVFVFAGCKTREDVKPENETTTPNMVRFI